MTCSEHIKLYSITKNLIYGAARLLLALIYSCSSHHTGSGAPVAQEWKELSSPTKPNSEGNTNTVCKKHQRSLSAATRNGTKFTWGTKIVPTCPDHL